MHIWDGGGGVGITWGNRWSVAKGGKKVVGVMRWYKGGGEKSSKEGNAS